ncbi:sterol regulatory element-binding protein 1-like isoform X2 [Symsagittifera roscoffensis]|uniref:sterol regulatory element-binding protein 1-like isoform X2 n=1 Tax=Symsagittifera roscoffensis TaxID=84072 RepID=UPI00307B544C
MSEHSELQPSLFGDEPSLDGFFLNNVMEDDVENGLTMAMDLPPTIDSLELESFLQDQQSYDNNAPLMGQQEQQQPNQSNNQQQIQSSYLNNSEVLFSNENELLLDDRQSINPNIQTSSEGISLKLETQQQTCLSGAGNVLSAPLAIQGELIQTTDAKTGQTYLLIVPRSNQTFTQNSSTGCDLSENITTVTGRPMNRVQPTFRSIDAQNTSLNYSEQISYQHPQHFNQNVTQSNQNGIGVNAPVNLHNQNNIQNQDQVYSQNIQLGAFQTPVLQTDSVLRQTLTRGNNDSGISHSSNGSSEQTSPVNDLHASGRNGGSGGVGMRSNRSSSSLENMPQMTQYRPIAMRPPNIALASASSNQVSNRQGQRTSSNGRQNVSSMPQSRFSVSSFANVGEIENVSYHHGSDSDFSPPPDQTITRDAYSSQNRSLFVQRSQSGQVMQVIPGSVQSVVVGDCSGGNNSMLGKPRSTHNVIEKRYRLSINDKIVQLKDVVLGPDVKMNKSGILQRAIDYIRSLENGNSQLNKENIKLRAENAKLKDQLNTSMEQVSLAASSVTALQTMVTVNQMNSPLNSQFTAAGGIIVPQRTIIPARPPKLTRPRQESSGASPGSSSGVGSVHSDPFCSSSDSDSAAPSSKAPKRTITVGLTDRSKVTLCMIMMCVFFFNPVGVMVSRSGVFDSASPDSPSVVLYSDVVSEHNGNRVLQSVDEPQPENSSWHGNIDDDFYGLMSQGVVVWIMNAIVVMVIVGKVFIFGEPCLHSKSDEYQTFKTLVAEADVLLSQRDYASGSATLKRSLTLIGCPVPVSNLDLLFSVIWRMLRLICQRTDFGRCVLRRLADFNGPKNATMKHAKEVAVVYHKLFQLYLTGCVPDNKLCGTLYGLTALTMSDFAYPIMSKVQLVEIVFNCAIGLRFKFRKPVSFLSRGLCYYGRRHSIGVSLPAKLDWLLSPSGNDFFHGVNGDSSDYVFQGFLFDSGSSDGVAQDKWCIPRSFPSIFTSCASYLRHDPLECLSQHYRQHLLTGALHATILPLQTGCIEVPSRSVALHNTMAVCGFKRNSNCLSSPSTQKGGSLPSRNSEPILDSSLSLGNKKKQRYESQNSSSGKPLNDCISFWWASIVNAVQAQQWFQCGGDDHVASNQTMGVLVEDMPSQLKKLDSSLAAAVQTSVIARRILLESRDGSSHDSIVAMCDKASALLAEAVKETSEPSIYLNDTKLRTLALVFCGDVLLATRKELWESMLYLNDQDGEQLSKVLEAYKGDLKVLKSITNVYHPAKEKCYFYETVSHMMKKAVVINIKSLSDASNALTTADEIRNATGATNNQQSIAVSALCYKNNSSMDYVFWEKMVPVYVKRRLKAARNALRMQAVPPI